MPCLVMVYQTAALLQNRAHEQDRENTTAHHQPARFHTHAGAIAQHCKGAQVIHFHEVKKTVSNRPVLANLTLFLPKASYTLISGGRQSGKTTLVRMITANEKPDEGTLTVDGLDIGSIPEDRIPYLRRQIGLIADTPALLEDRTVGENISVPLQLAGFDQDVIDQRLNTMLEKTGLTDEKKIKVARLTVPTRQLVSTARAIVHKPPIVVADEPWQSLDDGTATLVASLLNDANTSGATVLVTCQNANEISKLGVNNTTALELSAGSVTEAGLAIKNDYNNYEQNTME